ncbi:hypothetical protein V8G54_029931 [Vigna mungo]|uniref:Uncharacterized protein n=1 Tax=Vigna mungo TaxID=3915 RepID=A0AAQ3RN53_VIGMU
MNDLKSFGKREEDCSRSLSSGKELSEAFVKHRKVNRALVTFKNLYKVYECENPRAKNKNKARLEATMTMRREHQWENIQKCYWVELNVIGLHRKFWNGIDYKIMDNSLLAISILATDRYDNARRYNGTLVYKG